MYFIWSLLFSHSRTGPESFLWFMFTYNLRKLHLIRKMLGSQYNIDNTSQPTSQYRGICTGNIPAKVVSADCIHGTGLSIKREQTLPIIPFMGLLLQLFLPSPFFLPFLYKDNQRSHHFRPRISQIENSFGISANWPVNYPVEGWILDQYSKERSEID